MRSFLIKNKNTLLILSSFVFISILSIVVMSFTGKVAVLGDTYFHIQRINELKYGIEQFNIPRLSLNFFNSSGDAVMVMYPYLTLLPFAIAGIFIKSVIGLFYFMFAFYVFIGMVISFYSSKEITSNFYTRYLFAIVYGLLGNFTLSSSNDFGVNLIIIVLPISFFGLISLIKRGNWIEFSIGMSLILYSNLLGFVITVIFYLVILLINYHKINQDKLFNLLKATIMTLLFTAPYWIPMIKLLLLNNLNIPKLFVLPAGAFNIFQSSINLNSYVSIGMNLSYIASFTMIIGIFFYKKMDGIIKQFYLIGTIGFLIYTSKSLMSFLVQYPFPFLKIFQFTTRFYFVPQLLLSVVFAVIIIEYLSSSDSKLFIKKFLILSGILILSQMSLQYLYVDKYINNSEDKNNVVTRQNEDHYYTYFCNNQDYWPKESLVMSDNILFHKGLYDINKTIDINSLGNGKFTFDTNEPINELNIPFFYYNGVNYEVNLDGKDIATYHNKTSLITLYNVPKGKHHLYISPKLDFLDFMSYLMFLIGLFVYIELIYEKRKKIK